MQCEDPRFTGNTAPTRSRGSITKRGTDKHTLFSHSIFVGHPIVPDVCYRKGSEQLSVSREHEEIRGSFKEEVRGDYRWEEVGKIYSA